MAKKTKLSGFYIRSGSIASSAISGSINSASFATTASYALNAGQTIPNGTISSSTQFNTFNTPFTGSFTGSFTGLITQSKFDGYEVVSHRYLELYPTDITIVPHSSTAYFYISGSDNDLWYTHKTDSTVNFDWIEGILETGLLHGGIAGFSGSNVYIRSGSGIIVNHGATTGSAPSPTINYINWPDITSSIDVTNQFVTYLSINSNGIVESSSTKFTSLDYNEKIPLGAVGHFNQQSIAAKGEQINTQYGPITQLTDFARNFGPIKVGGYGISAQSGSLKFSRSAGTAFIYGGFYSQNPETPSNYQSPVVSTGSFAYVFRSGSTYRVDANNNNFYTDLKPGYYDNNSGTTASLASGEWSIQRVFVEPVSNIHYIYYGQEKYTSFATAVSSISSDPFSEGPATTLFTVFVGYIIMKGDTTDLSDVANNSIISAGLFRNTSAGSVGGGAASQVLSDLTDVSIVSPVNGQALIYNAGTWNNGTPSSASFATTASAATSLTFRPTTASFALTASAASSLTFRPPTASFAQTASFIVTSSYALTASYAANAGGGGGLTPTTISFPTLSFNNTYTTITSGGQNLDDGTYAVSTVINDNVVFIKDYRISGILSWYTGSVDQDNIDEIFLHRTGNTPLTASVFMRTRAVSGSTTFLEIGADYEVTASSLTFKFVKLI